MAEETCDVLIAGAGVIGVAIARELRRRHGVKVVVLEKESTAGRHASGRNSGVLHAGVLRVGTPGPAVWRGTGGCGPIVGSRPFRSTSMAR
ncbi:MAG: FAD-dependent oxidoreductase [Nitrospira sp.]|nr:FAD-dependent oxidoreductase [Nitrospira sp.]